MIDAEVTMRIAEYCLILCSIFLNSNGLDCRSEGGPKENELKNIYNICMKQQNKNNSNNGGDLDRDWKETRRYNQWSESNVARNRESVNRNYGMEERGHGDRNRMESNRDRTEDQHNMSWQNRRSNNRDNRMQHSGGDGVEDVFSRSGDERTYSGDGRGYNKNDNDDIRSQRNSDVNGRNDFLQNENFSGYSNQYSTQSSRRYKRERQVEVNSGKRSQYNPNPQRYSGYQERSKDNSKNSSENNSTSDEDSKSCAVHCLLENLQMTDESGMPDRYLVTHAITKDVKDEDLKDFLQESIEECFQMLDNENTDDKCVFSKDLMMCLSEKGRANCDDWKDDFQF